MTFITCPICKESKNSYGKKNICKKCYMDDFNKKYYIKNKEKIKLQTKKYYHNNWKICNERRDKWKEKNREKMLKYWKEYHKEYIKKYPNRSKEYYSKNKEKMIQQTTKSKKYRYHNDTNFRLKSILSARISQALLHNYKSQRTMELIGCKLDDLKAHLENKFQPGMSWKNHKIDTWHIDHIVPCDSFNLEDPEEQKKCFHYTNLQPLWAIDNIRKSNKIEATKNGN
jgi:hypothetical protein